MMSKKADAFQAPVPPNESMELLQNHDCFDDGANDKIWIHRLSIFLLRLCLLVEHAKCYQ